MANALRTKIHLKASFHITLRVVPKQGQVLLNLGMSTAILSEFLQRAAF